MLGLCPRSRQVGRYVSLTYPCGEGSVPQRRQVHSSPRYPYYVRSVPHKQQVHSYLRERLGRRKKDESGESKSAVM